MIACDSGEPAGRSAERLGRILTDRAEAVSLQHDDIPVISTEHVLEAALMLRQVAARDRRDARPGVFSSEKTRCKRQSAEVTVQAIVVVGEAVADEQHLVERLVRVLFARAGTGRQQQQQKGGEAPFSSLIACEAQNVSLTST